MGLCRSGDAYCPGWLIASTEAGLVVVVVVGGLAVLNVYKISGVRSASLTTDTELPWLRNHLV